jgi:TonB-linked SusC/RagA family outer membrane protein
MAIYRQNADGSDTDEYYLPNRYQNGRTPYDGDYLSYDLRGIHDMGNPVAIANEAWVKDQTYRLTPDFTIKYEILGTEAEKSRLTFNGRVDFDIFAESKPTYWPSSLSTDLWTTSNYNATTNYEYNSMKIGGRTEFVFTPYFRNRDWSATMLLRYELSTSKNNKQETFMSHLPNDITSPTVNAYVYKDPSSSNGRSNSQNLLYNGHASYLDGRYSLGFSLRADGDSKFGPKNKWAYFPGVSARWNIIDEPFMKWSKSVLSMLGFRFSWGINGKAPDKDYLFYNMYNTSAGSYGKGSDKANYATLDGLKLDDLRWEKTNSYNVGLNLGLWDDKVEVEFEYYHKNTTDLLQGITIPSYTGYTSIAYANVGRMTNDGWELNFTAKKFVKVGKFSADFSINMAQNTNLLKEMDESVLQSINGTTWDATRRGNAKNPYGYPVRVQINNSLGSIYGFRYQGVYNMTYDYLQNYQVENGLSATEYEDWVNALLSGTLPDEWYTQHNLNKQPYTAPVAVGSDGKVLMTNTGEPQRMVYDYSDGSARYKFQGGDAKYEDINHDGQINALDVVYLGNSLPKINGGFNLTLRYGPWSIKGRFNFRFGNKVVNLARMNLESMYGTNNQSATVNYRWRKDGNETPMPRAMYNAGWNFQASDRYVEDGGFLRFQNLQIAYNFDRKMIKKWGLSNLQAYASINNLYVWTRYSGTDPEVSAKGYYPAFDEAKTPRSKQFTLTLNVGF